MIPMLVAAVLCILPIAGLTATLVWMARR